MALVLNTSVTNLGTTILNIPATDVYSLSGTLQLPSQTLGASQGPGGGTGTGTGAGPRVISQVLTVVKHNTSTIYTGNAGDKGFALSNIQCSAGDTLSVILSSSLSIDQASNAVKMTLSLEEGGSL